MIEDTDVKLYFAPNSRAVRTAWLLYELGLEFELERYQLGDKAMRGPQYRAINPNARVPVLDDGAVRISESPAIAQYLSARYGAGRFEPAVSSPAFPVCLQWLHYGEGMLMGPINNYMVETIFLPPERQSEEHARRAQKLMGRMMQAVDAHMEGRAYLAGDFTIADTITGHACYVTERCGVDLDALPHARAYVDRLLAREAFQKALAL